MPEPTTQTKVEPIKPRVKGLSEAEQADIREHAIRTARSCGWLTAKRSTRPKEVLQVNLKQLRQLERRLYDLRSGEPSDDVQWLYDNLRLVHTDVQDLGDAVKALSRLPLVRTSNEEAIPRAIVLARGILASTKVPLNLDLFSLFIEAVQEVEPLRLSELLGMPAALKLAALERIAEVGHKAVDAFEAQGKSAPSLGMGPLIRSLRFVGEIDWSESLEKLSVIHRILLLDPAGVYGRMEFQSRDLYRKTVAYLSSHSDCSETEVARIAVRMAENAVVNRDTPDALRGRLRHVGYYIIDDTGAKDLWNEITYRPGFGTYLQSRIRRYPDELYIIGIEAVTLITVVALMMSLVRTHSGFGLIIGALLLILPAAQAAVELMNYFVTTVLTPRVLPKFDFSNGVDASAATMVAIPTLLINEKQIRGLVDDLEIRYLVNRDPNIIYALLTDLPDSAEPVGERDDRVDFAIGLIDGLNEKYSSEPFGGFYLFHRHRVYNPRERAWMGWERKRGKLLDLNQLLRHSFDPFPVKTGDMTKLPNIQYVLTLDSDTQLPRGSAQRMIGAMAHPLNRPLVDPELNIVTQGYGILQPRVGISVHSATRSRLANIYSGQTGFDIYSRAVSDVYQDLYGEGIFTGKGIYDVDALRQVLEHRFPRNALLSHDLIEGAYARAGLVSDIEVIDDYPSHYSAYNRRKHRWLRGDWQIVRWIFNKVPDESRKLVANPISLVSRWKIVDNLRRSLMEPATFALLVAGWFFLPGGPRFWTFTTLALLFLPIYFRLMFASVRIVSNQKWGELRESLSDFVISHFSILLNIAFLAHQTLVALDAIVRTIIRSTITHSRLLEWETATEAELGIRKRTPVDVYLDWIPLLSLVLALALFLKPRAVPYALPFILAWCFSKLISNWLNRSPLPEDYELSKQEHRMLRDLALRTWRYFAEFSNDGNNWLIPDNVQEEPYRIAERFSPTNLGFLFNSRQAALEFGYLTIPEFLDQNEKTFAAMTRLERHLGHFVNWYDNKTLQPIGQPFVSSVDSGNLVASLLSLKQGCLELIHRPLIHQDTLAGLADHHRIISKGKTQSDELSRLFSLNNQSVWIPQLLQIPLSYKPSGAKGATEREEWWLQSLRARIEAIRRIARDYMPWLLPEYEAIRKSSQFEPILNGAPMALDKVSGYYTEVSRALQNLTLEEGTTPELLTRVHQLLEDLPACRERMEALVGRLNSAAARCQTLILEMSFTPLVDKDRKLLSIGYDVSAGELAKSCYDLLASEARSAAFIAVAKGEIHQDCWFRLGRQHTACEGENVLISWTGTMFEYLMPAIWMKSHPNTLLDRAVRGAVRAQQSYGASHRVPWGISEAAYSARDADMNYQYHAFGVPGLALNVARAGSLVISPYSSCLALLVDPPTGVENLQYMAKKKWLTDYGFYESADYTGSKPRRFFPRKYELVRCWMAHHQGMSLVAICSTLHNSPFQRWFHAEPIVQASELILQERPLRVKPVQDTQPRRVLSFARSLAKGPAKARASA